MDHKLLWVGFILLVWSCHTRVGESLSVKPPHEAAVERINFRPRAKTVFKPNNTKKEMLYGSVIWFKPKEVTENVGNKGNDVIRLRSRNNNAYGRPNKSTVQNKTTGSVKNKDKIEALNTNFRQMTQAPRKGKALETN
eukprot:TRINITY_DN7117_c0_g1_i2.p1 TRINITY_DN7117_c0_g1~~TRINITY_DN7117_c0_g1_i2.p1  ORF type:complete len:138 (-),score=14.13 TRINITY_DN7117_c0_g1_i2:93-506(-)